MEYIVKPVPNVLITAPSLDATANVSGISSLVIDLIVALKGRVRYEYVRLGAPQIGSWLGRRATSLLFIGRTAVALWSSPASIFHSNTAFDVKSICRDLVLIVIASASGKSVLLHVHGGRYVHERARGLVGTLISRLLSMADRIVFLSSTERKAFEDRYPIYSGKMESIYNSLDLSGSDGFVAGTHDGSQLQVAFIGRLVSTKGIDVVIKAACASYSPPVQFFIHGDGPFRGQVEEAVAANPRLKKAELFSRREWCDVLRRYDILLLPSSSGEGMPMVILEAMILGVVPIVTPIASIPEVVENGERGIVLPTGDSAAIVRAIASLNDDRSKLGRMRDACRAYAKLNFDVRVSSARFFDIYRELNAQNKTCVDSDAGK
jgi:glycosyltransferase involved in cell wall biosynthesis